MFRNIYDDDSIHTQNAHEVELRVRAREEQRYMLGEDWVREEAGLEERTSNPGPARLAHIFSDSRVILQAVVGLLGK